MTAGASPAVTREIGSIHQADPRRPALDRRQIDSRFRPPPAPRHYCAALLKKQITLASGIVPS